MRLFEIAAPQLYLCTHTAQKVGGIVTMDEPTDWLGGVLEAVIEAQRPEGSLPRAQSLILSLSPRGADYTYVVEPNGRLERQHEGWLKKLAEVDPSQPGVQAHYAQGYWSGRECPEARGEPWEYRTAAARVLRRIGGSVRIN